MFEQRDPNAYRHRNAADVRLKLNGEPEIDAVVYLTMGQRLSDLLNDERAFLPVRMSNGETAIVAKTQISSITEKVAIFEDSADDEQIGAKTTSRAFDPYATLRVSPQAGLDEIRAAYKKRMKAVHPDAIAALCLDEDLSKAALLVAQRVNYAYQKIMREREDAHEKKSAAAG